jgi:hypothetical protein
MRARSVVAAAGGLLLLAAGSASAQSNAEKLRPERPTIPSPVTDHFYLRGSYYSPKLSTDARLDSDTGALGTLVSGERDLGLDDKADQGRMEISIRMRERNRLRVDFFKLTRNGDRQITRPIAFGNSIYNVNDRVISLLDWRMLGFTYTRSVVRAERFEMGAGVGIHLVEAEARGEVRARNIEEGGTGVGPVPSVALDAAYRVARRWAVTARAQYISVAVEDIDGLFRDYHLDVQYRWKPNLAVGLGYSAIRAEFEISSADFPGRFALDSKGPELFFRVSF